MRIKKTHDFSLAMYGLAAVVLVGTFFINPLTEMRLGLMALLFGGFYMAGFIAALRHHRCPACDQLLPLRLKLTRRCPHCGHVIDYAEEE